MSRIIYDFSGENYIVTGASSGLGRQIALDLARAGGCVLAVGRNEERLATLRNELPGNIFTASLDVRDYSALEGAVARFVESHGKLNGGVHAAGIGGLAPLRSYDKDRARAVMDVSFWAGIDLLQIITKSKYGNSGTSTVLFSSAGALSCEKAQFAYASAKSAVITAVRCAAKEICAKGHRVNSILPGWIATHMTQEDFDCTDKDIIEAKQLLGTGKPEYVSGVVLFLLSSASCWITGSSVVVDGGYSS